MTKTKETYIYQESPARSTKINQWISDAITTQRMIFAFTALWDTLHNFGYGAYWYIGWWPYNPAKSIYDRMRVHYHLYDLGATTFVLEYSLDSGATWATFASVGPGSTGLPLSTSQSNTANSDAVDIDLSGITTNQYIGIRTVNGTCCNTQVGLNLTAFLWSTEDTPF